jgi:transketolase
MKSEDVFVLSKGHSAGALYVTLWSLGEISDEELSTFDRDGTNLCAHITSKHSIFATGSLGHGLSLGAGYALQKKLNNKSGEVYVLLSDGELQEGSTQEAMNFIEMRKLDNLTMIVDSNGLQGFDRTLINPNRFGFVGIGGDELKSLKFYLENL